MMNEITTIISEIMSDDNVTIDGRKKYEFLVDLRDGLRKKYAASKFPDEPM